MVITLLKKYFRAGWWFSFTFNEYLYSRLKEYEELHLSSDDKLSSTNKELALSTESNRKLQRDLKEMIQQKEELEQRISNLEQKYLILQRECSSLNDLNNRLETELAIRENSMKHVSKIRIKNVLIW